MEKRYVRIAAAAMSGSIVVGAVLWCLAANPVRAGTNTQCVTTLSATCSDPSLSPDCHTCHTSLQAAVDAAKSGDTIRVAGGSFAPGGTVAVITKSVTIQGGFNRYLSAHNPNSYVTVLNAGDNGSVISITGAGTVDLLDMTLTGGNGSGNCGSGDGCGGGIFAIGTNLAIEGLVLTGNVGSRQTDGAGGGFWVLNTGSLYTTTVIDCRILSNTASTAAGFTGSGGGGYVYDGSFRVEASEIAFNMGHTTDGAYGGGLFAEGLDNGWILSTTFLNNMANAPSSSYASYGGGLYQTSCDSFRLQGNRFEFNAAHAGGAMNLNWGEPWLEGNRILSNTAASIGGGVSVRSRGPITLSNNLIAHNTASYRGGGIDVATSGSVDPTQVLLVNNTIVSNSHSALAAYKTVVVTLTNNILGGNPVGITGTIPASMTVSADTNLFWNTQDHIVGENAIKRDPMLAEDFAPKAGSPANDCGLVVPWLTSDLNGNPRPQGGSRYDLGAFETDAAGAGGNVFLPVIIRQ